MFRILRSTNVLRLAGRTPGRDGAVDIWHGAALSGELLLHIQGFSAFPADLRCSGNLQKILLSEAAAVLACIGQRNARPSCLQRTGTYQATNSALSAFINAPCAEWPRAHLDQWLQQTQHSQQLMQRQQSTHVSGQSSGDAQPSWMRSMGVQQLHGISSQLALHVQARHRMQASAMRFVSTSTGAIATRGAHPRGFEQPWTEVYDGSDTQSSATTISVTDAATPVSLPGEGTGEAGEQTSASQQQPFVYHAPLSATLLRLKVWTLPDSASCCMWSCEGAGLRPVLRGPACDISLRFRGSNFSI